MRAQNIFKFRKFKGYLILHVYIFQKLSFIREESIFNLVNDNWQISDIQRAHEKSYTYFWSLVYQSYSSSINHHVYTVSPFEVRNQKCSMPNIGIRTNKRALNCICRTKVDFHGGNFMSSWPWLGTYVQLVQSVGGVTRREIVDMQGNRWKFLSVSSEISLARLYFSRILRIYARTNVCVRKTAINARRLSLKSETLGNAQSWRLYEMFIGIYFSVSSIFIYHECLNSLCREEIEDFLLYVKKFLSRCSIRIWLCR